MKHFFTIEATPEEFPGVTETGSIARTLVLVVDGDRVRRTLLETVLAFAGFATCSDADGAEALDEIDMAPFNLVITESVLPGID